MERATDSRLTFVRKAGKTQDGHVTAIYQCACGQQKELAMSRVRHGYVRSCGCLTKETAPAKTHGMRNSKTYSSWMAAKDRTTNPKSKDFHRYGAVGIGFAERWLKFENFLEDMGERPSGTTLDRIEGDKGYEPGNCRWATPQEQARNRKSLVIIDTPEGPMPIVDYAAKIGITNGAAHLRLKRGKLEGCSYAAKN